MRELIKLVSEVRGAVEHAHPQKKEPPEVEYPGEFVEQKLHARLLMLKLSDGTSCKASA